MSEIFFIADTHFGSDSIRNYENRPFSDADEMDKCMIGNWNSVVSEEDTVFHLGDFGADGKETEMLRQLNGRILLVKGNHDTGTNEYYRKAGFAEAYDYPIIFRDFWILSHEPLYVNTNMPYANIFGHVHANPIIRDYSSQHFCVCVERLKYTPISFSKIKSIVAGD